MANLDEIPSGKAKTRRVYGRGIMIANLNDKVYALNDRCAHNNALLSLGNFQDNIITCPNRGARFDIATGEEGIGSKNAIILK